MGIIITFLLATSGTYFLSQEDNAFYCADKDMVMICEKLSSGIGTRCYFNDTYKICNEGWKKIEVGQELTKEIPQTYANKYSCNQIECIEIN